MIKFLLLSADKPSLIKSILCNYNLTMLNNPKKGLGAGKTQRKPISEKLSTSCKESGAVVTGAFVGNMVNIFSSQLI